MLVHFPATGPFGALSVAVLAADNLRSTLLACLCACKCNLSAPGSDLLHAELSVAVVDAANLPKFTKAVPQFKVKVHTRECFFPSAQPGLGAKLWGCTGGRTLEAAVACVQPPCARGQHAGLYPGPPAVPLVRSRCAVLVVGKGDEAALKVGPTVWGCASGWRGRVQGVLLGAAPAAETAAHPAICRSNHFCAGLPGRRHHCAQLFRVPGRRQRGGGDGRAAQARRPVLHHVHQVGPCV